MVLTDVFSDTMSEQLNRYKVHPVETSSHSCSDHTWILEMDASLESLGKLRKFILGKKAFNFFFSLLVEVYLGPINSRI